MARPLARAVIRHARGVRLLPASMVLVVAAVATGLPDRRRPAKRAAER